MRPASTAIFKGNFMETHNSELIKEIQNATKIPTLQGVSRTISNQIVPVIEVNPKVTKNPFIVSGTGADSSNVTLYTTPTNQDVYVIGLCFTITKDGANTSDIARVQAFVNGQAINLAYLSLVPSVASGNSIFVSFSHPLKLDRGTIVSMRPSNATASIDSYCSLQLFVDDSSNA